MCFTHFTVIQNGWTIGGFTAKEMAVSTAKQHAVDTGKPVTVVAHVAGGGSREAIFNSDGTNDKIWNIDKGRPLVPSFGQVYVNRGGGEYPLCVRQAGLRRELQRGRAVPGPAAPLRQP